MRAWPIGYQIWARGRSRMRPESSPLKRARTVVRCGRPILLLDLLRLAGERQETLRAQEVGFHSVSFAGRFFLPGSLIVCGPPLTTESLGRSRDTGANQRRPARREGGVRS